MGQFALFNFLTVSIPEEFLMAFFVWAILGKKDTVKFVNVVITGLVLAFAFVSIQFLVHPYATLAIFLNLAAFMLLIYFIYRLNFIEAIIGALLATVVMVITQAIAANIVLLVTDYSISDLTEDGLLKTLVCIPEFIVFSLVTILLYKHNIKFLNFKKKKKVRQFYFNKFRYMVLQLTFTLFIILYNFRLYSFNKNLFESATEKALIVVNLCVVVLFTVLVVNSVFKMGKTIQKEEELKRKFDGREYFQNIDYLCNLMNHKKYEEVSNILNSIKSEVNTGIVDKE